MAKVYGTITYITEHGEAPEDLDDVDVNDVYTADMLPVLSANGYVFVGWALYGNQIVNVGDEFDDDDIVLVAVWEKEYAYVDETSGAYMPRLANNNVDLQKVLDMVMAF